MPTLARFCALCEVPLTGRQRKYCLDCCPSGMAVRYCEICGGHFHVKKSIGKKTRKTCSEECARRLRESNRKPQLFVPFECCLCGAEVPDSSPVAGSKPHQSRQLCGPCKSLVYYLEKSGKQVEDLRPRAQSGECSKRPKSPRLSVQVACLTCGGIFVKKSANQKFCDPDCYMVSERQKEKARAHARMRQYECSWCGTTVSRKHGKKRYFCGRRCQMAYKVCVTDGIAALEWPRKQPCISCGVPYPTRSKTANARCPDCTAIYLESLKIDQPCQDCGEIVCARPGLKRCGVCKKRRYRRKRKRKDDNRHLRRRAYIVDRDGGRCQVCRCQVVWGNPLHPRAGEIDHIIPRSLWPAGEPGKNDPSNLRLLCRTCNAQKSNGTAPGGDQLLLVG